MGLLGNWITNQTAKPFYAIRKLTIDKPIAKAEAKVCGLGQFNFFINGAKVGDHELDPAWTDYNKLIQYVSFDVTDCLKQGDNVIGAEVGNGWFIKVDEHYTFAFPEFMPPNPNPYKAFSDQLVLAFKLEITYTDESHQVLTADDRFLVKEHPVVMTNVYGSETIDGRKVQPGWCSVGFDSSDWEKASILPSDKEPKGQLMNQFQPAVKVIKEYPGTLLGNVAGRDIYDFSQNMSGILDFEAQGKAGDEIKLYPAEKLEENGDVDQMAKGWVNLDSCITYILGQDDSWEKCRMKFTYFAGRYVAVELPEGCSIRGLRADAITSAYETDGTFACDDKRYEEIYSLVEKAVEANMVGVHTDCPTIERFAWQEPNHLMAPAIMYMKNGRQLWDKFLLDMRTAQHDAKDYFFDFAGEKVYPGDGLMPSQCPCYIPNVLPVPGMGSFYDIIGWGSTSILGTYWHYNFYGDKKIIEDNYDAGLRYLNHLKTKVTEEGFINHGLGDWGNPRNELARENVETAFLYADAKVLAWFAGILGRADDEQRLLEYAKNVKDNYNSKLLVKYPEKGYWCYKVWDHGDDIFMTQAAEAMPLYWGLVPEEYKEDVVKAFRDTLEQEQAFIAGEIGLPYIIQTARQYGMNDLISSFILRKEHPSYYAFVLDGETTLGEYWETNPRSHCHDMMGHIVEWYYNGIAGIQALEPGFTKVKICPYLPETIHEFKCSYRSAAGTITVHVKENDGSIKLHVGLPKDLEHQIDLSNLALSRGISPDSIEVEIHI